ncbi:RNB family domain-containing protein [Toxoplasma gondii GAB2-2007-GAL-DOM2]|uniref:RNB family domain-containing protein n=1 Tax=Toxoplasma gondii GAB2-2007-GAL-DOM2 TaxID=1130820 RepID=A0A086K5H5_TOXGO|nr:RNB family domain-containing protein [Toxoplasma gondii GAB2-2007-GAL-DOM2]
MEKVYREKVTRQLSTEALSSASGASGATTPSQGNSHRTATNAASRIEAGSGGERRGRDGGERRREAGAAQTHLRDGERRGRRNAEKTGPPGGRKEERETEEGSRRGERKKQFEEYVSCQQAHAGTEEGIYVKVGERTRENKRKATYAFFDLEVSLLFFLRVCSNSLFVFSARLFRFDSKVARRRDTVAASELQFERDETFSPQS